MVDQERNKLSQIKPPAAEAEELPYRVELWNAGGASVVERVLARAVSATLARAIFKAAQEEFPGRRITLSRGPQIIAHSAE